MGAIAIGGMRWGRSGALVSLVAAFLLYSALADGLSGAAAVTRIGGLGVIIGVMALVLVPVGAGWLIYRKVPV